MNWNYVHIFFRFLLVLLIIILGIYASYHIFSIAYPFIIALILAFFINPLVNVLEGKGKLPRSLAVFISILAVFAAVAGIVTLLIVEIVSGTEYLAKVVPGHFETLVVYGETFIVTQILPFFNQITAMFHSLEEGQQQSLMTNIENIGGTVASTVGSFIQNFLTNLPKLITWIPSFATVLIFSLLATFFISKDWYKLKARLQKFTPPKVQGSLTNVFSSLKRAFFGFLRAQATLISITTIIVLIGLLILRVEYAITVALIIGLIDLIPYLGTGLIFVPWIIFLAISGNLPLAIGLGVLYLIVIVQRQLMEPKILSTSIGLDPLATLISLFVGFQLMGFLGLIAGPVVVVIFNTLWKAGVFKDIYLYVVGKNRVV
ncbi:sporulation integral membrane protein YtvI [Sutcliffiella rhizosphaerae]|uniref:Sodium-lithium/proton antiporter n=1 Tax=Sutcliffiella rhizosphaerae TaxID=2880967 RepID=A0ABM8YI96_9BACI|nr:sporulation integral membrane protein YtvI [Sutcliffiella rhizosphaerae]CAG9619608.1 Sodium-lithium/proton antiporter [Sutcliffiella rhizosphaerae]